MPGPLAFLLTWTTYGAWLHGDERKSVDDSHNQYGRELVLPNPDRYSKTAARLSDPPLVLTPEMRKDVERAIRSHCEHRNWRLFTLNVRSNHVHVVVGANDKSPELIMKSLKAWASRTLRRIPASSGRKYFWTRHGSTRYLWDDRSVHDACRYVRDGQDDIRFRGRTQ